MEKHEELRQLESFEVLEESIRRDTERVARAMGLSAPYVRKFKEPPSTHDNPDQSGSTNPLDRIAKIIETIKLIDEGRAYLPIEWLCARFGFMPPVMMPATSTTDEELVQAILKWTQEFGETSKKISEGLKDGRLKEGEYKEIYREFREDLHAGAALMARLEEMVR